MARQVQTGFERNVIPGGRYTMQLIKIEDVQMKGFNDGDAPRDCWRWTFVGFLKNDTTKKRHTLEYLTGTRITPTKDSKLKSLLMGMVGEEATFDQLVKTDPDDFIRKNFAVRVTKVQNDKGDDVNGIANIEPYDNDDFDPFTEE